MNLSSYLQMPPAPQVPTRATAALPVAGTGAGPSAATNMGFDFADVMARQLQSLVPLQRQTIAADTLPSQEPQARSNDNSQGLDDRRSATPQATDQAARETDAAPHAAPQDTQATDTGDAAARHAHPRARVSTQKAASTDASLTLGLAQAMPVMPATPLAPVTVTVAVNAAAPLPTSAPGTQVLGTTPTPPLQTIELSSQVRIITDPKKAPSPESLAAFAKSMGLDESAIQNLLGQAPTANAPALPLNGLIATPNALQAAMGTALHGLQGDAASATDSAAATQLAALSGTVAATAVNASGAGVGTVPSAAPLTAASVLPGLNPTDMAAIQQLQITVLPAAVLPVNTGLTSANTPTPSTIDMLSLLGTGVDEKAVNALLTRFSEEAGNEGNPDQQPSQSGGNGADANGNNLTGFGQALTRSNNGANPVSANAAQAVAPNMSEVYDKLSDKMTTELAARMHKQLSDGEWKMKFGLRPANLGGVEVQLEMKDGKLDAVFRADNPLTRDLLQNSSQRLRDALGNLGINAGQVQVGQGGGNAQQNNSGQASKQPQVRDNSSSPLIGSDSASSVTSAPSKTPTSLLDLYA